MNQALIFVVKTLFDLYIFCFIIRFVLRAIHADFRNPLSQFVIRVTNPVVVPLSRAIPRYRGWDTASLVCTFLLTAVATIVLFLLGQQGWPDPASLALLTVLRVARSILKLYLFAILIHVILGWVSPGSYNPMSALLASICEPVLRPVRRLIPAIGGLDLSPLFILIGLQALLIIIPVPFWLG